MPRNKETSVTLKGSWYNNICSGGRESGAGTTVTVKGGVKKTDFIPSDGFTPTDYACLWAINADGQYESVETIVGCPSGVIGVPWTSRYRYHTVPFGSKVVQPPGFYTFNGSFSSTSGGPPAANFTYKRLNIIADKAILQKVLDQKLSLGVTLGEAKETMNLVLDLAEDLVSAIKWVKHGIKKPGSFVHYMLTKPSGRPNLNGKPHWHKYAKMNDDVPRGLIPKEYRPKLWKQPKPIPLWKQQQAIRKMSQRQLADLGLVSRAAANRWLQVRYGCTPAYNDMLKITEQIIYGRKNELDNLVSARVTIPYVPDAYSGSTSLFKSTIDFDGMAAAEMTKCFQQIKVWFKVKDPKARDLVQRGLHPMQLASTLYELTSFSFMLDWVYPLGDTLELLAATIGLDFVTGYRSMRSEIMVKTTYAVSETTGFKHRSSQENAAKLTLGAFHRVVLTKFPSIIQVPTVENPYGVHTGQRITDTVSILYQMGSKPRRVGII